MAAEVNVVTITVRHSAGCKYAKDAYSRRCDCRKTLVYYVGGVRQRKTCNTRSWAEAERQKDELEDQLAGRAPESATAKPVTDAVEVFLTDKRNQGVSETTIGRYELELDRFVAFATAERVFTVQAVNRELLTKYAATWSKTYAHGLHHVEDHRAGLPTAFIVLRFPPRHLCSKEEPKLLR